MQELHAVPQFLATMAAQPHVAVLVVLLVIAAVIDWRTYRIPNWLTVGGMLFGLLYNTFAGASSQAGLLGSLAGLGVGLAVLLPMYVLRVMGAGDVKLMAMVGAFVGLPDIFSAILFTLIAGGAAAVVMALHRKAFGRMTANVRDITKAMLFATLAGFRATPSIAAGPSVGKLPYGISIAAGSIGWLVARQLGLA